MSGRLAVRKTYKLFIGGAFPRSESGRTLELEGYNVARASRKDAREAVVAARKAFGGWSGATAYNRGQVLYRLAETIETRAAAFATACSGRREVARAIDRVVWYAGWADKLAQVLGSANPVAGPYFNFTIPEPTGVVAVVAVHVGLFDRGHQEHLVVHRKAVEHSGHDDGQQAQHGGGGVDAQQLL